MQGDGLREWLWRGWASGQGLDGEEEDSVALTGRVVALLGATGVGKTTTIAKLASKLRQRGRQNIGILTLDTHRVGAADQMRRFCKLLGVTLHEVVTEDDARVCADWWDRFDWIGIDTPGGMAPGSPAHRLYGSILAEFPDVNSLLLLPAGLHEADGRAQMERARQLGARRLIFSKIDETTRPGGMVNLTMDGSWKIDSVTTGQRVPEDWMAASATTLWSRVLAPEAVCSGVGA